MHAQSFIRTLLRKRRLQHLLALVLITAQLIPLTVAAAPAAPLTRTYDRDEVIIEPPGPPGTGGGMTIILGEGAAPTETVDRPASAETTPLSAAETQALLDRLPPLPVEAGDAQDFRLPPSTLPAPRTGTVVTQPFPPAADEDLPTALPEGPLEVLRYAPDGDIPVAPFLSVTFNQPMVSLGTLEQLDAATIPVALTPELTGEWRWIGDKTLTFDYTGDVDRFPKATEYTAEVPAGTTSMTGGVLAEAVRWSFRTPAPRVMNSYPGHGPQSRDPLFFIAFDQRIEPAAILDTIQVTAARETFATRLATEDEVAADETVQRLAEEAGDGRWLAFRTETWLPAATTVNVAVGPGTPSAEGPLTTDAVQSYSFQTYAPLRIAETYCQYGGAVDCPPLAPFTIRFNNPLDSETFDPALVTIEPAVPDLIVEQLYDSIRLRGATQGRTEYTVTIAGALRDTFGQSLGEDATVTFRTGDARSSLVGPEEMLITVDPSAPTPSFGVYSINYDTLRVRGYAVTPEDWPAYQLYLREHRYAERRPEPPGELILEKSITVQAERDQLAATEIDLGEVLPDGLGQVIVTVDVPTIPVIGELLRRDDPFVVTWVQGTQIGLDAFADAGRLIAWATGLQDGAPLADVDLNLLNTDVQATTDAQGTAALTLPLQPALLLVGRLDDDLAILPAQSHYWDDEGWRARPLQDELRWYVMDDRQVYRPGESVHIKGWLRRIEAGPTGDIALPGTAINTVTYEVYDPRGNELDRGTVDLSDLAGFDLAFDLPEDANLGYASIQFRAQGAGQLNGADYGHSLQIQEFRRPEFEVVAQVETEGPHFLSDEVEASVTARYFAGGPLPGADTTWDVSSSATTYAPPNWPDYVFGEWTPWWFYREPRFDPMMPNATETQSFAGRTDAAGKHYLEMTFAEMAAPRPYQVTAAARVMDVNRQTWASSTNLLVHPAAVYVGVRSPSTFVQQGQPLEIDVIVTDVDGNSVAGRPVEVTATRVVWQFEKNEWVEKEIDPQNCTLESSDEAQRCTFATENGGEYRITADVRDADERLNRTIFTRWVAGGEQPPVRNVTQEEVLLIPDKESYAPGETAEILVQSPFTPAEGLLTVMRSGILYTERFTMNEATTTLRIPLEEAYIPNLHLQVDLVGAAPRTDEQGAVVAGAPARPAYAKGTLELTIPPLSRTLDVALTPAATELAPGAQTTIDVAVTDATGAAAAGAEVAVVVVDEAILALSNYTLADPVALFYQPRSSDTQSAYGRDSIVLADASMLVEQLANEAAMGGAMPMAAMAAAPASMERGADSMTAAMDMAVMEESAAAEGAGGEPIAMRSDFNPLALFAPAVYTDEAGQAMVEVTLPDNLTRYRIMAVVVAEEKYFGSAEANLTARLPLMVRPSAPRFLNFGDRIELPVVIQNQTDEAFTVDLAARGTNLQLSDATDSEIGVRVDVPANDRVEVRLPAATVNAGTARLQFAATAGDYADAQQVELPIYTPATTEAFAAYGTLDDGTVVQPIARPEGVFPQFGGLEITTSSTALQALTDAVLYLNAYPFECSEQIASRVMGIAALRDVLSAFQAEGLPTPAELEAAVSRDILKLEAIQNPDGGWPVWNRGAESIPFYGIHVAHALQRAEDKGFRVTDEVQSRALDYLRNIETHYPYWYSAGTRHTLSAYALYVRQLMGDVDVAKAQRIYAEMPLDEQSLDAVAWLWQVFIGDPAASAQLEEIRRHVTNRAVETPGAANFITGFSEQEYLLLQSNRRTDALLLDAIINDDPTNDLIPKVVNGLLAHRTAGRWNNTQENVFVLLAMDNYFNTFEAQTPDFVARMWLGEDYVAEHAYQGRSVDSQLTTVPMDYLLGGEELQDLLIDKDGPGRLYYRLGMRYAPEDLDLDPLDMGFVVQRSYEAVDDPDDVQLDEEGVWRIKPGARVRVRIEMVAPTRRYHVALTDPLPAGFEAINPALAVSETVPVEEAPGEPTPYGFWRWGPWYEHQNLRDQRAEAFSTLLWEGVYEYSYVARATTPGDFVVPPASAEEMYSPEVFGRSGTDRVVIE